MRTRLLWTLAVGLLVVVVLLCAVPLFIGLGADAQLQSALARPPADIDVEVQVTSPGISQDVLGVIEGDLTERAPAALRDFAPVSMTYVETNNLAFGLINGRDAVLADPALMPDTTRGRPQAFGFDLAQALPHMRLLAGRAPRDPAPGRASEALATPQSGLRVGDVVTLPQLGAPDHVATVAIVGVWFPKDEADPYWNGRTFRPAESSAAGLTLPPIFPLVLSSDGFAAAFSPLGNTLGVTVHRVYFTDPSSLTVANMRQAADSVTQFRFRLTSGIVGGDELGGRGVSSRVLIISGLEAIIKQVGQQFAVSDLPLYVVVVQVVALALLFVHAMASLLVESHAGPIATLMSRGASLTQFVGAFALRGLVPALAALALGPPAAVVLALLLVRLAIPAAARLVARDLNVDFVVATLRSPSIVVVAAGGAALGLATLTLSAWRAARLDILAFRREQGRATIVPAWRRYNLDLGLAALGLAGYIELGAFGGLDVRELLSQGGQTDASALLLAAPTLLLLAGALLALRGFPLAIGAGARLAERGRGVATPLAFAELARGSARFTRLMLLLTLALAVSLFALTFQASLARNAADRAAYQVGSDVRATIDPLVEGTGFLSDVEQRFAHIPGARAETPVARAQGTLPFGEGPTQVNLLAIDPATFAQAAYWRGDYADQPLSTLLAQMRSHLAGAAAGQPDAPIWALVSPSFAAGQHLVPGDHFGVAFDVEHKHATEFVVGAEVRAFPTMADADSGYIVVPLADLAQTSAASDSPLSAINGPSEYWLRETGSPVDTAALLGALRDPDILVNEVTEREPLVRRYLDDPLSAGITALLLVGAILGALLAILGTVAQVLGAARLRRGEFAVLRTLGVSRRELMRVAATEHVLIGLFGVAGGTLLGVALSTATLPYLQFSIGLTDTSGIGGPPYVLTEDPARVLALYAALALAFALALGIQRLALARMALGELLRIGED